MQVCVFFANGYFLMSCVAVCCWLCNWFMRLLRMTAIKSHFSIIIIIIIIITIVIITRPHRARTIHAAYCDRCHTNSVVCVLSWKMVEPIDMPFGGDSCGSKEPPCIRWGQGRMNLLAAEWQNCNEAFRQNFGNSICVEKYHSVCFTVGTSLQICITLETLSAFNLSLYYFVSANLYSLQFSQLMQIDKVAT